MNGLYHAMGSIGKLLGSMLGYVRGTFQPWKASEHLSRGFPATRPSSYNVVSHSEYSFQLQLLKLLSVHIIMSNI